MLDWDSKKYTPLLPYHGGMKRIVALLLVLGFFPLVGAQELSVSKVVEPAKVLIGEDAVVTITIASEESVVLRLLDLAGGDFHVFDLTPMESCTLELEELTNASIIRCSLEVEGERHVSYGIRPRAGGFYSLPEVRILIEGEEVVSSRSDAVLVVSPPMPTFTEAPPPTPVATPESRFPIKQLRQAIGSLHRLIVTILPESIRFFLFGIILFLVVVLVFMAPFYFMGRKKQV